MTAENLKNWLKEQMKLGDGQIAVGAIDGNQDRYIGVYDGKASGTQRICVGGRKYTKYQDRAYVVLIHWTTSPVAACAKAMELYDLLHGLSGTVMDGVRVVSADPGKQPEWAGREGRICEYVIRIHIRYERNEENG
mgnify:FL=1